MSQVVKANIAQVIFPQDELEMLCYIVRLIGCSHIVYKDILVCKQFLKGKIRPAQIFEILSKHLSQLGRGDNIGVIKTLFPL